MLKKLFVIAFLLSITSLSFAKTCTKITVAPSNPSAWGYGNARVYANHQSPQTPFFVVNEGVTFDVSLHSQIFLEVGAMNIVPELDQSCQNIMIEQAGSHLLLFELGQDWKIHCQHTMIR